MNERYLAIKYHQPENMETLTVRTGEKLVFERRKTQYRGWLWCTTGQGQSGWVPEAWVRIVDDTCVMLRDYDASELSVNPGDVLKGNLEESGWILAEMGNGLTGWVPLECIKPSTD